MQLLVWCTARPTAVVRGIDDEGVVLEFILFQRIHNAADMVVHFLNRITVFAPIGFPLERFADPERDVQHGVRQVEKERTLLVGTDELHGLIGVQACELGGVGGALDDLAVADQRHAALFLEIADLHRIQVVQQPVIMIESLIARQERFVKAEVPFADAAGGVAVSLE